MTKPTGNEDREKRWRLTREKILMSSGLMLIGFEAVIVVVGLPFRFEFLLAGLALCGVSITQWKDRGE